MKSSSLAHLSDGSLLRHLAATVAGERGATADVLASIAEVDARRLYAPAGYTSMYRYCVHELHLSEQAAYRRILAARAARRFRAIFAGVAEGRRSESACRGRSQAVRASHRRRHEGSGDRGVTPISPTPRLAPRMRAHSRASVPPEEARHEATREWKEP